MFFNIYYPLCQCGIMFVKGIVSYVFLLRSVFGFLYSCIEIVMLSSFVCIDAACSSIAVSCVALLHELPVGLGCRCAGIDFWR